MKKTQLFLSIFLIVLQLSNLNGQEFDESKLPKMLGANNVGTEFYFTMLPCYETAHNNNFIKIYISSAYETEVTVEVVGKDFKLSKTTIPNNVISFDIPPAIGQAYRKNDREEPMADQIFHAAAIHVVSDAPVICYGMTRYQYTSDGFLALPLSSLGKDYIVASYADPTPSSVQFFPSYTAVVAPYDGTKVRFTMGGTDWSTTASGQKPGEESDWNLNKGDVLLFGSIGEHAELSGSKISSTKPVSVISGHFCAYVPTNCGCCDFLIEQELPKYSWGNEYHVTNIKPRQKNSIIKVFSAEPNTAIYRDYQQIGMISENGGIEGVGYLTMRADEGDPRPIVISGDKPISVTQYNTGQMDDNVMSDPFQMVLEPIEQYQNDITFATPGAQGGNDFPTNYINLCYPSDEDNLLPEDILFGTFYDGELRWQVLRELSPDPGFPFASNDDKKKYFSKTFLLPGSGVYKIKADRKFAAYSYGFSAYDSYGFPASGMFKEIIGDMTPPLPFYDEFTNGTYKGTVSNKYNRTNLGILEDNYEESGLGIVSLFEPESFNYKLSVSDFIPGNSNEVEWELNVIDIFKDARAVLLFSDRSGNDTTLVFTYTPVSVDDNPKFDEQIKVYPQPITNKLNIEFTTEDIETLSMTICDNNGKQLKNLISSESIDSGSHSYSFDINDIPSGHFILTISLSNKSYTKKIIVLH